MRPTRFVMLLLFFSLGLHHAVAVHADDAATNKTIAVARKHLQKLVRGDAAGFHQSASRQMRDALPPEKLTEIWKSIEQANGRYQKELDTTSFEREGFTVVVFTCAFERTHIDITISIDKDQRVAGLFFKPVESTVPYEAPEYVNAERFSEQPVTIVADRRYPLPGTLTMPKGNGPFPGVVLVHGSGPNDRDETIGPNKPFKDIALGLASRGIAVLRYDKRTHKHGSQLNPLEITIDNEVVDDALAAAQRLMAQHGVDKRAVFVLGHSLGATAAPRIATKDRNIAGIIMLAAAARPLPELVEDQLYYLAEIDGVISGQENLQLKQAQGVIKRLRENTWEGEDTLLDTPAAYWAGLNVLKPVETVQELQRPVLILHGGRDYQVNEKDYAIWQRDSVSNTNVVLKHYAAMDHMFRRGTGVTQPESYMEPGHLDGGVVEYIANWIDAHATKINARD